MNFYCRLKLKYVISRLHKGTYMAAAETPGGNSIQDMIAAAASAVGTQTTPAGATPAGGAAAAPTGVTIERHSARTIEGRAKSGI